MIRGSNREVNQAPAMGIARDKGFRVSGMIVSPRFYEMAPLIAAERAKRRIELG
jgi:hypothetical protein